MSVSVFILWLLLWNAVDPLIVVSGLALSLGLAAFGRHFWPNAPRVVRPAALVKLSAVIMFDIVIANIKVAAVVLFRGPRVQPARVLVPLEVDDPFVATLVANTVTLTPGTLSAALSADTRFLEVHCLHLDEDPADIISLIKTRYEARWKEVFGC